MGKKKILLLMCILIILMIIIILLLLLTQVQNNTISDTIFINDIELENLIVSEGEVSSKYDPNYDISNQKRFYIDRELDYVSNYEEFYFVNESLNKYIDTIINKKNMKKTVYLLDGTFLEKNKDIVKYLEKEYGDYEGKNYIYRPDYMKDIAKDAIHIYFVYGNIIQEDNQTKEKKLIKQCNFIVKIDYHTCAFSIIPETNLSKEEILGLIKAIPDRKTNRIRIEIINNKIKLENYIKYYFEELNFDIQKAYEILDEDYRRKRFNNNIEEFEKFINKYFYKKFDLNIYTEPICLYNDEAIVNILQCGEEYDLIDENKNYSNSFVLKENYSNNFKIMLDKYTVVTEEVKNYYMKLSDKEKAEYNCKNIKNSIQTNYYEYSYEYLSDDIKQNIFKTYEEYEEYLNNNTLEEFYYEEDFELKEENGIYKYTSTLKDFENNRIKTLEIGISIKDNINFDIISIDIK